jgi:hypothetical protein
MLNRCSACLPAPLVNAGGSSSSNSPLDQYVSDRLQTALQTVCSGTGTAPAPDSADAGSSDGTGAHSTGPAASCGTAYHLRLSTDEGLLFADMLRAASASRLAYLDPTLHLCVHPQHGPWVALRGIVVLDLDASDVTTAACAMGPLHNPFPSLERELHERTEALVADGGFTDWKAHWREWVALRELAGAAAACREWLPASCCSLCGCGGQPPSRRPTFWFTGPGAFACLARRTPVPLAGDILHGCCGACPPECMCKPPMQQAACVCVYL